MRLVDGTRVVGAIGILTLICCGGGGGAGGTNSVSVTISPRTATVAAGSTLSLTATVAGAANNATSWQATGGSLSDLTATSARWTAPSAAGTYSITVSSQESPASLDTCQVTVTSLPGGSGNLSGGIR